MRVTKLPQPVYILNWVQIHFNWLSGVRGDKKGYIMSFVEPRTTCAWLRDSVDTYRPGIDVNTAKVMLQVDDNDFKKQKSPDMAP